MVWPSDEDEETISVWENLTSTAASVRDAVLPKSLRRKLRTAASKTASLAATGLSWIGNGAWVAATATLVLVLPLALEVDREQQLIEMEEQMRVRSLFASSGWAVECRGVVVVIVVTVAVRSGGSGVRVSFSSVLLTSASLRPVFAPSQQQQQQQAQQAQFASMPGATPLANAGAMFPGGAPVAIPQVQ